MFFRRVLIGMVAAAMTPAAFAGVDYDTDDCDVDSHYEFKFDRGAYVFSRDEGSPRNIRFDRGVVTVDGKAATLNAADRAKLQELEARMRAMAPEIKAIALEGADIGLTAVQKVMGMFESNAKERAEAERKLAETKRRIIDRIEHNFDGQHFDDQVLEREIEAAVQEILPDLIADVVKFALVAAFTGDEAAAKRLEQRAEQMEKEIEREVEGRAKQLERRADRLCERIREFDRLENQYAIRLPSGSTLDLVTVKR